MTVLMAGLCLVLVYGMVRPKTPNAFDTPAAQEIQAEAPWATHN